MSARHSFRMVSGKPSEHEAVLSPTPTMATHRGRDGRSGDFIVHVRHRSGVPPRSVVYPRSRPPVRRRKTRVVFRAHADPLADDDHVEDSGPEHIAEPFVAARRELQRELCDQPIEQTLEQCVLPVIGSKPDLAMTDLNRGAQLDRCVRIRSHHGHHARHHRP
jgi:hypothetical protein